MQKELMETDAGIKGALLLNRLLFEGKGTEFLDALADYVLVKQLKIDKSALDRLVSAAESIAST